MNQYRD